MKNLRKFAAVVMLVLISASVTPSQSIARYTQTLNDDPRAQVVSALERAQAEVKASRELIKVYEERIPALERQVDVEKKNGELLSQAYFDAVNELAELRAALKHERAAMAEREKQVEDLKRERDDLNRKLSASRKRELGLTLILIATTILPKILK